MITIQQLAAFCMLLTQGPGTEVFGKRDDEHIRNEFKAMRSLQLEVAGLDYTPELIELQVCVQPYVKKNTIPPVERLNAFGFFGEYMHWFWSMIAEIGEDEYFARPVGAVAIEFAKTCHRDDALAGWLIYFIDGQMHYAYRNALRQRESVAKILNSEPKQGNVFPYLKHFSKP